MLIKEVTNNQRNYVDIKYQHNKLIHEMLSVFYTDDITLVYNQLATLADCVIALVSLVYDKVSDLDDEMFAIFDIIDRELLSKNVDNYIHSYMSFEKTENALNKLVRISRHYRDKRIIQVKIDYANRTRIVSTFDESNKVTQNCVLVTANKNIFCDLYEDNLAKRFKRSLHKIIYYILTCSKSYVRSTRAKENVYKRVENFVTRLYYEVYYNKV